MSQPTQEEMDGEHCFGVKIVGDIVSYFLIFRECLHAEYKEAFSLFDDQGDGKIESDQIGCLLRSLNLNPDDDDIEKIEKDVGGSQFSICCQIS